MWTNLFLLTVSVGMGTGSIIILRANPNECAGIRIVSWSMFFLHIINFITSALCLCGLEKKWCGGWAFTGFFITVAIILVWANVTYFQSQKTNCMDDAAAIYFWLMGEIMFYYVFTFMVICFFFRKFCEDPNAAGDREAREKEVEACFNKVIENEDYKEKYEKHRESMRETPNM